jgi:hypothetical protein
MIPTDISETEVENFKALLEFFKRLSDDGVNSLIEKQLLLMLDHAVPFFSNLVLVGIFDELKRITINKNVIGSNKRIHNIKYLKYPPSDKVKKYGRCNLPGQSVFYSSFLTFTAMDEMKPRVGDLITETTWKVKAEQPLIYCPIFKNQPTEENILNERTLKINQLYENKIKDYPEYTRKQIDTLVQFVTDAFTKRIHPNNHLDYIFSAYFSNKIFHEFENGKIEAIYYPSVQSRLSFENVAMKHNVFDSKYELVKAKDSLCVTDPSDGRSGYFFEGLAECKSFDYASGRILWEPITTRIPPGKLLEMKMRFGVDLNE